MKLNLNINKAIYVLILFAFFLNTLGPISSVQAAEFYLPKPGTRVPLSPSFNLPILKGIKVHPENPFRFEFILDQGDSFHVIPAKQEQLKQESTKLIKYFLASLTIPEKDLWVNLSPYEKNRIIPQSFGQTEMGRDLLAEDYMLKQITASLIYPEGETGKKFWKRIYEEAVKKFGTTNIPVNTFNKVWIVPEKAVVYENAKAGTAYVVEANLKVMLEQDYLALQKNLDSSSTPQNDVNALGSQVIREIVIPELTREVNEDKNFVQLRQVYNSLILATWYKKKIKESLLGEIYENRNKVVGILSSPNVLVGDPAQIYQCYIQAFKKGVYNYIKDTDMPDGASVPRKYFSGGADLAMEGKTHLGYLAFGISNNMAMLPVASGSLRKIDVDLKLPSDTTMNTPSGDEEAQAQLQKLEVGNPVRAGDDMMHSSSSGISRRSRPGHMNLVFNKRSFEGRNNWLADLVTSDRLAQAPFEINLRKGRHKILFYGVGYKALDLLPYEKWMVGRRNIEITATELSSQVFDHVVTIRNQAIIHSILGNTFSKDNNLEKVKDITEMELCIRNDRVVEIDFGKRDPSTQKIMYSLFGIPDDAVFYSRGGVDRENSNMRRLIYHAFMQFIDFESLRKILEHVDSSNEVYLNMNFAGEQWHFSTEPTVGRINNNPAIIQPSIERRLKSSNSNLTFQALDEMDDAAVEDGSLSLVVASNVLTHFDPNERIRFINMLNRKLKPYGVFLASKELFENTENTMHVLYIYKNNGHGKTKYVGSMMASNNGRQNSQELRQKAQWTNSREFSKALKDPLLGEDVYFLDDRAMNVFEAIDHFHQVFGRNSNLNNLNLFDTRVQMSVSAVIPKFNGYLVSGSFSAGGERKFDFSFEVNTTLQEVNGPNLLHKTEKDYVSSHILPLMGMFLNIFDGLGLKKMSLKELGDDRTDGKSAHNALESILKEWKSIPFKEGDVELGLDDAGKEICSIDLTSLNFSKLRKYLTSFDKLIFSLASVDPVVRRNAAHQMADIMMSHPEDIVEDLIDNFNSPRGIEDAQKEFNKAHGSTENFSYQEVRKKARLATLFTLSQFISVNEIRGVDMSFIRERILQILDTQSRRWLEKNDLTINSPLIVKGTAAEWVLLHSRANLGHKQSKVTEGIEFIENLRLIRMAIKYDDEFKVDGLYPWVDDSIDNLIPNNLTSQHKIDEGARRIIFLEDSAMKSNLGEINVNQKRNLGGIDLTSDKVMSIQNSGQGIAFRIDPAQLQRLQNAPGFVPVIVNIEPMADLRQFLGLNQDKASTIDA